MVHAAPRRKLLGYPAAGGVIVLVAILLLRLAHASFTISGDAATPVLRGAPVALDVRFTNRYDFPISVTGLTVTVQDVRAPHADAAHECTAGDFVVRQASGTAPINVGARATSSLSSAARSVETWPQVGLVDDASSEACRGALLKLGYSATRTVRIP